MNWDTYWADLGGFLWTLLMGKILPIVVIVVVVVLVRWLLQRVIRRVVDRIVSGANKTQKGDHAGNGAASPLAAVRVVQRSRTLGSVLTNIVNIILFIVALLLIVSVINEAILSSFTLLTAAVGAGLGFGAQNIVRDTLNGLFMVMEDQLGVGDIVDLGQATGLVEMVGIRITQVRDVYGTLWFVRNGEILRVGNMSQGWTRVIIDVSVPPGIDTATAEETIHQSALTLTTEAQWQGLLLGSPEVWGLESITADAAIIRVTVKTHSGSRDEVARELRTRLKDAFDEQDIQIRLPGLNATVIAGFESAPGVRGSRPAPGKPLLPAPTQKSRSTKSHPATGASTPKENG